MSTLAEGFATFVTFEGALTLGRLLLGEGGAVVGFPSARPHPKVDALMAKELCTAAEGFPTLMAFERLRPVVNLLVLS